AAQDPSIAAGTFRLGGAQLSLARQSGRPNWTALKHRIAASAPADELEQAIRANDRETVVKIWRAKPELLHLPVWSGNWGPPMSHAANLGQLEIIQAVAALGGRDFQHAFDRAILQGQIACARWLREHGATLTPGIIMSSCETLNAAGFKFLLELGAPLTNDRGDPLAPLALVLETYSRNPAGKHAILESFAQRGYALRDTPIMAVHRGSVARLEEHLRRDPSLLARRFTWREIYPPELGCSNDGRSGMHWPPLAGTTLL